MNPDHDHQRRKALKALALTALTPTAAFHGGVRAQAFPSRPIRLLVGYPPGGNADTLARILAEDMAPRLGQPVVVDNRPGASGAIAQTALKTSPADGYTIVLFTTPTLIAALVAGKKITTEDLTPIGMVYETYLPILVSASAPLIGTGHGQDVVFGLIVIVVMLALPNGVAGLLWRLDSRFKSAIKSDPTAS